ncbi:MAG: DJ-1/PfpI family protein [Marinilabiliaceae bacterium]|nr:DJ-1/PfpI family protein [Marinilabiliaceae bacterium]
MSKKVYIFLAEGFEEVEAITPADVLRRANIDTFLVSISEKREVIGAHSIVVMADGTFNDFNYNNADMLILPGGMPGTNNLKKHTGLVSLIKTHNKNNKWIGAICAAPIILGENNILNNKTATCYPGFENQLIGANVTSCNIEVSQNIITGRGVGVAVQFSLEIVKKLLNDNIAAELSKKMVVF